MTKPKLKNKSKKDIAPKTSTKPKEDDSEYLSFSFRYLLNHTDFGLDKLESKQMSALLDRLHKMSRQKWVDALRNHSDGNGAEQIKKNALWFTIPHDVPDDCTIYRVRFYKKAPIVGYRNAYGTFFILAIDRNFKAYDHS